MDSLVYISFLVFLAILFLFIVVRLGSNFIQIFSPAQQIELEYTDGAGAKAELKEKLRDRWRKCLQPVKLQRFNEIPIAIPELPEFWGPGKEDPFQEINLKIYDVDFSSFYQKFSKIFQPSSYKVVIKKNVKDSKVDRLDMTLEYGSEVLKTWTFPKHLICEDWATKLEDKKSEDLQAALGVPPPSGAATVQPVSDEEDFLLNHAFYELFYYLYFDKDNKKHRFTLNKNLTKFPEFPGGRTLCAYYTGVRHLNNYQQYGNQAELNQALRFFQILQAEFPEFCEGSLLYGMALAENRDEPSAVATYTKVLDKISGEIEKNKQELSKINQNINGAQGREIKRKINEFTIIELQTKLWRATAWRRHYGWKTTHKALSELNDLINNINKNINDISKLNDKEKEYKIENEKKLKLILAHTYIELANTYTDYLYIFFPCRLDLMITALTDAPNTIKIGETYKIDIDNIKNKLRTKVKTNGDIQWSPINYLINNIYRHYNDAISQADKLKNELQPLQDREQADLECRLNNARARATFSKANWGELNPQDYQKECQKALDYLNKVELTDPQYYIGLLNLGTIYMDPWFDPCGETLAIAKDYTWRVILLKPNEPLGHRQLAYVYKKQAEVNGAGPDMLDIINKGIDCAKKALALRPQSASTFLTLAELHVMKYLSGKDVNDGKQIEKNIINYLNQAETLDDLNPRLQWSKSVWETARMKKAALAGQTETDTTKLNKIVGKIRDSVKKVDERTKMLNSPHTPQFQHYHEKLKDLKEKTEFVNDSTISDEVIINQFSEIQIFTAMPPPSAPKTGTP